MIVLLPPSEAKTAPARGDAVDLAALSHPGLTERRGAVLDTLAEVSAGPDAARVLGVGPGVAADLERNTSLRSAPAAAASSVYTGVLYAAARLDGLPPAARARARRAVRIVSGLWGLVSPEDRVPAYRLSMGVDLPGIGPLARQWRPLLAAELDPVVRGQLVVDCRSATYAAAWTPPRDAARVTVRVLREVDGRRRVVSHHAKHTRGVLTRHLLVRRREPATPGDLLAAARELVGTELVDAQLTDGGRVSVLTLTVG